MILYDYYMINVVIFDLCFRYPACVQFFALSQKSVRKQGSRAVAAK